MLPPSNNSKKSLRSLFSVSAGNNPNKNASSQSSLALSSQSLLLQQPQLNHRSLCVGDLISVYYQDDNDQATEENGDEIGFVSVKGFTANARCGLESISDENLPSNFKSCVFVVQQAFSYNAHKEFYKKLEQLNVKLRTMNQSSKVTKTQAVNTTNAANAPNTTVNLANSSIAMTISSSANLSGILTSKSTNEMNASNGQLVVNNEEGTVATNATTSRNQYVQAPSVKTFIKSHQYHFLDLTEEQRAQIEELERKMEREKQQNNIEYERSIGKEILYGQPIQLMHLKTKKYLSVNPREKAEKQKDCLKLTLVSEEAIDSTSHVIVLPYYKFRSEGDAVKLSDQVRFFNRKSNTFLHLGQFTYSTVLSSNNQLVSMSTQVSLDEDDRREINMIPGTTFTSSFSYTNWRIRLFSPYLSINSGNMLKAGDVIRLFHTELNSFLSVNSKTGRVECVGGANKTSSSTAEKALLPIKSNKKSTDDDTQTLKNDKIYGFTDSLWEVEMVDPTRGGALMWNKKYRFKHVSSGKYLYASKDSHFVEENEDIFDDFSSDSDDEFGISNSFFSKLSKKTTANNEDFDRSSVASASQINISVFNESSISLTSTASSPGNSATDQYWKLLKRKLLAAVKKEQIGVSLELAVKDGLGSDDTTFVICQHDVQSRHDSSQNTAPIPLQSYFRLKHAHSQTWVHGVSSDSGIGSSLMKADDTPLKGKNDTTPSTPSSATGNKPNLNLRKQALTHTTGNITKSEKKSSRKKFRLYATNVLYEQDVFSVHKVPQQELEDLLFVQSIYPLIESFMRRVQSRSIKKPDDFKILLQTLLPALTQLVCFLTDSDEEDPLKREGIPFKSRQTILRERGVIDMVMRLIEELVDNVPDIVSISVFGESPIKSGDENTWTESDLASYHYLLRNLYRVIKQSVKLNSDNGLYMSKYITEIQQHIKMDVGASVALIEILTNNYGLLNRMPKEQIRYFVRLLVDEENNSFDENLTSPRKLMATPRGFSSSPSAKKMTPKKVQEESDSDETTTEYLSAKNSIYLSFLSALCACGNRPIKKNQSYITELLFEDEKVTNSLMFPYFVDNDPKNKLCIKVNGTEYGLLEFVSKAMSQALSANTANFDGQDDFLILLNFFQKQIELLSLLCLGRNKEAIQYIQNKFSYELILACIKEKNLPFEIRSSFCTLLLNCFLDVDPYEANPTISFTRKWTEIEKMKKTQDDKKIKELRTFLTDFYKENYQLDCGNDITSVQRNLFIYNLVFMTKKMFELGMFDLSNIYPTHRVVVELLKVLDCTNDKINGKPALDAIYEENEQTMITTKIKQEVCEIFDIIKSQQLNVRVDFFLINFKYSFTVSDKSEDKRQDFVKNSLFKDSIFNESASVQNLTKILIDLTKCKNAPLAVKALNLLIRIHREKEELKDLLPRIELLVSSAVMKSYDNILVILKDLKNYINVANSSSGSSLEQYSKSIQQSFKRIEDDYEKNGSRTQRILRNLSAHELAIETLTMSFDDNRSQQRIHKACVRFLSDFVRKNVENQTILFPYLEFFMSKIGQDLGMSTLICEVVRNNRGLCTMLEERHIRYLIDLIAEHGLKARYLNFLKIILMCNDGNPIKRNQTIVTQNLLDRKKDVIVLFNDEEGIKERDRRIKNKEHETQPDGILCYHIELLSLLAECGDGRNHVAEVKLQSLLSIEDILKQLLSPNTIPELRNPLLLFLDEVYINADKVQDERQMSSSSPIFRLLAKIARELDMFVNSGGNSNNRRSTEIILTDPLDAKSIATPTVGVHPRNTSSQDSNPLELVKTSFVLRLKKPLDGQGDDSLMGHDSDEKLYVDIKYIFQLMIPFIHHYFHLKFPPNDFSGEPQQLEVIKAVIENLFNLYQIVSEAAHKEAVIKCLQAMCKVGKSGNQVKSMPQEFTQEIFKFLKEASSTKATQFKQHMQKQQNKQLVVAQKKEDEDEKYMRQYKVYVSGFTTILTQESNFANLGILLYEQYRGYLDMIVNVIRRISELVTPSSKDAEIIAKAGSVSNLALYSIEMLKQIMNTQQDESVLEKLSSEQRQRKLNKFHHDLTKAKIPELVLEMVCSENHKIMKSAIELGISMLFEGNNIVQGYIYSLFKKGTTERFFLSIRDRIRLSIDEIKERKAYYKRQQEKKLEFKQYRAKKLRRGDTAGNVPSTPTAQSSSNPTDENEKDNEETFQEEFEEKGHIAEILRFLQLMTEGHNNDLQHYLAEQKYNTQSFNIVEECLYFIVALEKDITADNIETAIQCFDSLTEFVQGPCLTTQQVIGMSPKFYFVCNEIMSKDYKGVFKLDKCLELKGAMFICLTSLLEGSNNHKIAMIMRDSLNFPDIMEFLKKCCIISFSPTQFIDDSRGKGLPKIDLNIGTKEEMTSRIQAEVTQDGFRDNLRDKQLSKEKQKRISEATEQYEEIAFQIYFLLNTLSDGETIIVHDNTYSSMSTYFEESHRKISHLLEATEYSRYLVPLEKETGRMEIVRNNTLENVYYRIPNESNFLSERSRKKFLTAVNSEEYTAQEKIRNFFDQTDTFYTEIVHYKQFESDRNQKITGGNVFVSFLWKFLREDNWSKIKLLSFLLSLIINCIVLFGFKKMYAVTPGDIPLPGFSDPDDSSTGSFQYQGDWKTDWIDNVQTVLGVIQLVTTSMLFVTYLYFFATLEVKKKFKLKMGEKWEDVPRDRQFYRNYLKFLAKDFYISFLVVYWVVSVLGLTINPIVYAIHLFEVVVRFDTLYDIVLSIQTTAERFVLTSMLMIVAIWFFSLMIFAFVPETFYIGGDGDSEIQFLCDSAAECMLHTLNYGLRTGGFFEDEFTPSWGIWTREIINMLFILVVIVVLFEVVFGIILESFAELREKREKTEDRLKNKCFICDIERARFDQKANEGITFNNHVKKEHNMWNYLFFLIHLNRKLKTEYTGSEQYVSNCVHEQDISFFPILRSITLENVEYRARLREESSNSQQGGTAK